MTLTEIDRKLAAKTFTRHVIETQDGISEPFRRELLAICDWQIAELIHLSQTTSTQGGKPHGQA